MKTGMVLRQQPENLPQIITQMLGPKEVCLSGLFSAESL